MDADARSRLGLTSAEVFVFAAAVTPMLAGRNVLYALISCIHKANLELSNAMEDYETPQSLADAGELLDEILR